MSWSTLVATDPGKSSGVVEFNRQGEVVSAFALISEPLSWWDKRKALKHLQGSTWLMVTEGQFLGSPGHFRKKGHDAKRCPACGQTVGDDDAGQSAQVLAMRSTIEHAAEWECSARAGGATVLERKLPASWQAPFGVNYGRPTKAERDRRILELAQRHCPGIQGKGKQDVACAFLLGVAALLEEAPDLANGPFWWVAVQREHFRGLAP